MKQYLVYFVMGVAFISLPHLAHAAVVDELIAGYQATSGQPFDAKSGERLWQEKHPASGGPSRSCQSCHGADLKQEGKHIKTHKKIKAMAPSVNRKRLTDAKFIEKWFRRNCKWAWGRQCTAAEKGAILMFLKSQ